MVATTVGLEAISTDFMRQHSRFSSLQEMLDEHGLHLKSPPEQLDRMVRAATAFQDWQEMFTSAAKVWITGQLIARLRPNGPHKRIIR
ncbi:hypothetical protein FJU31_03995 [Stenotrophomonas cyclobalanopsidis]|uniref:Uncharacterized protein n=1 Tax=Stenotrophomonas cyclobalanopsidis TaxID=2771362 RepID=A0ABQ6T495_9GAMM|nr:hypothetical protein [Stenotrophomonas cyclobalanopsidis]KAA9003474.1 hypothetical protein FJU31_03995 [Stenotrophomonas cyclobalanopsidis]